MINRNFSDDFCDTLVELNYTHCFYVAGGNIMHLLNAARSKFKCIPVIHEVAAVVATEYFNESSGDQKAFALVTAGPGITNCVTGIAGAWLESRELLVVGGQVKSTDLKSEGLRQRGIQEIDGVSICGPITKLSKRIEGPINSYEVSSIVRVAGEDRPGPVFLEICLDAQAAPALENAESDHSVIRELVTQIHPSAPQMRIVEELLLNSNRPVILIGGGVGRDFFSRILPSLEKSKIPIMTTWNAADRITESHHLYWGRPNTWGQRSANVLIQQADLLISIGSRLGLQQTGFNWQGFIPLGKIIQVDIDELELTKGHPEIELGIQSNAESFLEQFVELTNNHNVQRFDEWLNFGKFVHEVLPLSETVNLKDDRYINPYDFILQLSECLPQECVIIPCSSGGAFTTFMQAFKQKMGQKIITNKGLASMGYGLSGAIGSSLSNPGQPVILLEGDGGFAQNLQEVGTVKANNLPIKIFIYDNSGYASIRMTQKNYFNGAYMGCDIETGLGLPDWSNLFATYGMSCSVFEEADFLSDNFKSQILDDQPRAFIVPINPEQTYYPKISSKVLPGGGMISAPLHEMTPPISPEIESAMLKFFK
jgi:acetolactate synthase-1/2/3 large subunit